jgi:hypothetical protein
VFGTVRGRGFSRGGDIGSVAIGVIDVEEFQPIMSPTDGAEASPRMTAPNIAYPRRRFRVPA